MRKVIIGICSCVLSIMMMCGCSIQSAEGKADYTELGLDTIKIENLLQSDDDHKESNVKSELDFDETSVVITLKEDTNVYSSADYAGSVCGWLEEGEEVAAYSASDNWYKVSYCGRVAYVPKTAVASDVSVQEEQLSDNTIQGNNRVTTEKKAETTTEKKSETTTEKKPETTTEKKSETTTEKKPETTTEEKTETTTEKQEDTTTSTEQDTEYSEETELENDTQDNDGTVSYEGIAEESGQEE